MRALIVTIVIGSIGCASEEPIDELDGDVITELSTDQGSASGADWTGSYTTTFTTTSCDCPTLDLDGVAYDVCILVDQSDAQLVLTQADGFLVMALAGGMMTGAVEADGSFVIAGRQDTSTAGGPITLLSRMDGSLDVTNGQAGFSGSMGQRIVGSLASVGVDCRWLGTVEALRID